MNVLTDHFTEATKPILGVVVDDVMNKRLIESAAAHLGLATELVTVDDLTDERLLYMEMVLADEAAARALAQRRQTATESHPVYNTPIVAVVSTGYSVRDDIRKTYDGVLPMPQPPDTVAAQLSLTLYSHRSFVLRYEDQKQELQRHRQIFGSIASGVCVANATEPDLPVEYVNPAFEALTGYTLEECREKNCRFLQGSERDQPGRTRLRDAIRDGKPIVVILRNFKKDGSGFWNEISLAPIRSADGTITHFVAIQSDVTQRVEFERALRESEKLAVTGRLASVISHEINNPLGSITNLTYLARRSETLSEVHAYLDTLDRELRRIKFITDQALRFARQSSSPAVIRVSELLRSILEAQHARIHVGDVQVELREHFSGSFIGFESEVRQVLNILIANATDALRSSPGTLYVRSRHATGMRTGEPGVLFTIADSGEGMSDETKSNLYKAFYTTRGSQGTGLGLWIGSEIVKRHRGSLRVRSRRGSGSGTVFQMFLPCQPFATGADQIPPSLTMTL